MTLEQQIKLMEEQASQRHIPHYIRQSMLLQIEALKRQEATAKADEEQKRPTLTLKKGKV